MADIYALQGTAQKGKTSTIKELFSILTTLYPSASVNTLAKGADIKVIITGIKGQVIGIESCGDPGSRLSDSLKEFKKKKCDIIFCACRTRGGTVNAVTTMNPPYKVSFVPKAIAPNKAMEAAVNHAQADALRVMAGL